VSGAAPPGGAARSEAAARPGAAVRPGGQPPVAAPPGPTPGERRAGLDLRAVGIVFLKECRESLRDRRTIIYALLVGPLLLPLLFVFLVRVTISRTLAQASAPLPVTVIGAERAPNLLSALEREGLAVLPPVPDVEAAVRSQQVDLALRIPSSFPADWRAGRPAQVEIIYDSSRRDTGPAVQRLRAMLDGYSRITVAMRLMARGLAPTLSVPVVVAARDQATPQARGALLFAMLPYLLIFSALIGGMWLAIDSTAGERERTSLEPLLINPVPRDRILAGKLLATAAFAMASLCLALVAFLIAGAFLPANQFGLSVQLRPHVVAAILPVMVPLVLLLVTVEVLVAAFARSVREAQTYLGLVQLVPIIPSVVLSILPLKGQLWMFAVPLLGQQLTIMQLLRGEAISLPDALLCAVVTLVIVLVGFWAARRSYASERLAISS
jgi:sodium transport system permease protein